MVVAALAALCLTFLAPREPAQAASPGTVSEVRFQGSKRLSDEALRLQVQTRVGSPYSQEVVDQDLKLLASRFQIWGRSRAEVLADGTVRVSFELEDVPSVQRVRFVGNSKLDEGELREALGLSENNRVPVPVPGDGGRAILVRKLEEKYQEAGHLYCEIDATTEREADEWVLVFRIVEGPEVAVDDVEFEGLSEFEPRHVRSVMKTGRSFWFFTQTYKPSVLHDDVVKIEEFLRDEGFLDVRVAVESVTPNEDGDEVDLLIRIDQGRRYVVHSVAFGGNEKFSSDELRALVKLAPGMPYRQTVCRKDRARLLKHYRHLGYVRAEISQRPVESYVAGQASVDVTFAIREDDPKRVRDVRVVGNRSTRDDVVRRELDLYPNDLFDGDEMRLAEDRLRATGFFADDRGQPLAWVENEPTGDPRLEDVVMRVEDGTAGLFSMFGGLSSGSGFFLGVDLSIENFDATDLPSSPGATFEEFLDQRAFHGAGQKLHLRANPGNRYSNYLMEFVEPYLTGPVEHPVYLDTNLHLNEYTSRFYDQETAGMAMSVGTWLSRRTSVSLGFRQDRIDISNVDRGSNPIEDLLAVEGGNSVRALVAEWGRTKFDSLRNPTDGTRLQFAGEWLGGPLGAQYEVVKLSASGELLIPIWENEEEQRHVVSLRAAGAWARAYDGTDDVPLFERYFAGGPGGFLKLRSFEFRGIGPHDDNFPVGGSAGWVVNAEYVFPLVDTYDARIRESTPFLRGVLFVDQGMLEQDWVALREGRWCASAGVGVRMRIPFQLLSAPLELYYGIPLERARGDERESFQINFTTRF